MKHIFTILCSDILTDRETSSTTYYKAIDQIITSGIPVVLATLAIGTYMEIKPDQKNVFSARFRILNPNNEEERKITVSNIKKSDSRHRVNVRILNAVFKNEGTYKIIVETSEDKEKNWVELHCIDLPVTLSKKKNELEH